jgi:hypothetical protein
MTPFGQIFYYRKLSKTDEDIAILDPHKKSTNVLVWNLADFFNDTLCHAEIFDQLIPAGMLQTARNDCGPLASGEIYEANQTLLAMQMLKIRKVDALVMHKRLRDAMDPVRVAPEPQTIAEAIPQQEYRGDFS